MTLRNSLADRSVTHFEASNRYRAKVHKAIVGGAHTYSKGDDQFPALAPAAIARGKGGRVWDVDGNEYVDCALGLGAVSLGHAYEPVLAEVRAALELGSAFQRPHKVELELAEELLAMLPGMQRVKFAKNGSNVTTAAVKLARAYTGRDLVAFPGNHPFYSFDDWFIGKSQVRSGVPQQWQQLSLTYPSTDPDALDRLLAAHPGQVACVISEPEDAVPNPPEVIRAVEKIARKHGVLFILDEMVTGFRAASPGAYTKLGLTPDMTTWGKAIGNGFSFCALAGRADIMDLGGIHGNDRQRVFLLSSTHGGEAHTLAAARAVLREYRERDVIGHQHRMVARVAAGFRDAIARHGIERSIELHVTPWRVLTVCRDRDSRIASDLRTLLMQEMIGRGVLFQGVFISCMSHTEEDIDHVLSTFEKSCGVYREALESGTKNLLVGQPARPVFRKWNGCRQSCPSERCPHESRCRADQDA